MKKITRTQSLFYRLRSGASGGFSADCKLGPLFYRWHWTGRPHASHHMASTFFCLLTNVSSNVSVMSFRLLALRPTILRHIFVVFFSRRSQFSLLALPQFQLLSFFLFFALFLCLNIISSSKD